VSAGADVFDRRRFQSDGNAPLYLRLKRLVADAVDQGILAATEAIPGERDIARMLGISRVTVRKAFAGLVTDGVLVQRQGAGTFVARHAPRYELPMSRLTSFSEDMRLRGIASDSRWIDRSEGLPTPEETMVLALSPGEKVCRLHRLRRAGGVPLAVELAVVPSQFLSDPMAVADSLYAVLETRGFKPVRALQRLHAVALSGANALHLDMVDGSPALFVQRVSFLGDARVVEFTRSHFRGDSYDFVAELVVAEAGREGRRR
jgi:GntR family transcriptional regulator